MKTYKVTAIRRDETGDWLVRVPDVGSAAVVRRLSNAVEMASLAIEANTDNAPGTYALDMSIQVGDGIDAEVGKAKALADNAAELRLRATDQMRHAARHMDRLGLKGAEIAVVLDVSPQRVSQLLNEEAA